MPVALSIGSSLICPVCTQQALSSTIPLPGKVGGYVNAPNTYMDSQGAFHVHDNNTYTNTYTCSLNHTFTQIQLIACPQGDFAGG